MAIDLTLTLGDIITAGAVFSGALVAWGALRGNVVGLGKDLMSFTTRTEAQFDDVKAELKKLGEVMILLAESKGRMDRMDDRAILQGGRIDENTKEVNALRKEMSDLKLQLVGLQRSNGVP